MLDMAKKDKNCRLPAVRGSRFVNGLARMAEI